MEEKREVLTRPHLIRPAYLRALGDYLSELQAGCERNRCDYVLMNTGKPLAETLTAYLGKRLKMKLK